MENPESFEVEVQSHWKKHHQWIVSEWKREGNLWGVICGTNMVEKGKDLKEYPDEEGLMEIGKSHNLIPFAYTMHIPPETIPSSDGQAANWNRTIFMNDFYPSLRVKINENLIVEDFDTGASDFCFFGTSQTKCIGIFAGSRRRLSSR